MLRKVKHLSKKELNAIGMTFAEETEGLAKAFGDAELMRRYSMISMETAYRNGHL